MLSDPDFRELVTLPLPTPVLRALSKAGYSNIGEIKVLDARQIASSKVCFLTIHRRTSYNLKNMNMQPRVRIV